MNISIQCTHCQKRYNAPASLAGKKIKCKHCGQIFAIPAEPDEAIPSPTLEPTQPITPEKRKSPLEEAKKAAAAANPDEPVKLGDPRFGIAAKRERAENTEDIAVAEEAGPTLHLRPSIPFDFPGAHTLDRVLPTFLIVLGLGWLCAVAGQTNQTTQSWVTFVRPAIYLVLFLAVMLPIGWLALSKASRTCRFAYPPSPVLRTFAALSLGFALPLIFWLSSDGGIGMFIFGGILGFGAIAGALWFLFRLQPQELTQTLTGSAIAYILSMALTYGILLGIHTLFASTARSSPNNQLAASPMGPFQWTVPVNSDQPKHLAKTTEPTSEPVTTTQPESTTEPTSKPATQYVSNTTQAVETQPITPATTRAVAVTTEPVTKPITPTTRTIVEIPQPPDPQPTSPFVEKLHRLRETTGLSELLTPATPSSFIAVIKTKDPEDTIEVYSGNPLSKKWEATFRREKEIHGQRYILSPNGEQVARIITWPKLAVQIWSFKEEKDTRTIPLKPEMTRPGLIAFTTNDALLLHYTANAKSAFETYNIKPATPARIAAFATDPLEAASGNPSISPDGRLMAIAAFSAADNKGGIDLYDLTSSRSSPLRTYFPPLPKWIMPTGLCFAPDGKSFTAMFEQDGRGFLAYIKTADAKAIHEHIYTRLPVNESSLKGYTGRVIDYLADNTGWLYYGQTLLDTETGKPIGALETDAPKSQRVIDKNTVALQSIENFTPAITQVKLNSEAINAKVAELRKK